MSIEDQFDSQKMLKKYMHDYFVKNGMHKTAEAFRTETDVNTDAVMIDTPGGFMREWWSLFYDTYSTMNSQQSNAVQDQLILQKAEQYLANPRILEIMHKPDPLAARLQAKEQLNKYYRSMTANYQPLNLNFSQTAAENTARLWQQAIYRHCQQQVEQENFVVALALDPAPYGEPSQTGMIAGKSPMLLNAGSSNALKSLSPSPGEQKPLQLLATQHQHCLKVDRQIDRKRKSLSTPGDGDSTLDVEVYLSHGDSPLDNTTHSNIGDPVDALHPSTNCNENEHKGFALKEVASLHTRDKVLCCHFSSTGEFVACAGHERKASLWNLKTFEHLGDLEGHSHLITDVKFQRNSSVFATSSFDKSVQIWDATQPGNSLFCLQGHKEQVMSLDFHPVRVNLLCSCDINNVINWWDIIQGVCLGQTVGATRQVRFQPQSGKLLAATAGNDVRLIDINTPGLEQTTWQGHDKEILSICWDQSGTYLASVTDDCARLWSTKSPGKCIHELQLRGDRFLSCTFHPQHQGLLIIGGYQNLELWNPDQGNQTVTIKAHTGLISSLAVSPSTQMIASASQDHKVKLWM